MQFTVFLRSISNIASNSLIFNVIQWNLVKIHVFRCFNEKLKKFWKNPISSIFYGRYVWNNNFLVKCNISSEFCEKWAIFLNSYKNTVRKWHPTPPFCRINPIFGFFFFYKIFGKIYKNFISRNLFSWIWQNK